MSEHLNNVAALEDQYFKKDYIPENNIALMLHRVSTKEQEKRSSPKIQGSDGVKYTKSNNLHVLDTYNIAETAFRHEERKIFNEMINRIKKSHKIQKKIMHLVISHASRASRNKKSTNVLRSLVLDYGVVLHYHRDKLVLHKCSDQMTWDRWEKLHASSEEDNNERRMNSLRGMLLKYQKGIPLQHPPYGYKSVKVTTEDSGYAFESPYSSYMERAFRLALTGDPNFKTKLDKEFKGMIEKKKMPTARRLLNALKDPFYYGDFKVKDHIFKGDQKFVPPLIKKSLWSKVQVVIERRGRNTRPASRNLSYTGTMKCGGDILNENGNPTGEICGGSVSGEQKLGRTTTWGCGCSRKNCSQRKALYMKSIGHQRYYAENKIDEMLLEIIRQINLPDEILQWFKEKIEKTVWEQSDFTKNKYAKIQSNIIKKENLKKKLAYQNLSGMISPSEYQELKQELLDEIQELHEQKLDLEQLKVEDDWIQQAVMKKISDLHETFEAISGYSKNKIILSFCNKLILKHGSLLPEWKSFMISDRRSNNE